MLRVLIEPSTYRILDSMERQNPFVKTHSINLKAAEKNHALLAKTLTNSITYKITDRGGHSPTPLTPLRKLSIAKF
jgi:hypothetical protein